MLHLFRRAYRRIKRFIAWFPIIWRDEDWQYSYLYEIMEFKISQMRKEFVKNDRHTTVNETVKTMKVVEELLRRLGHSDFYYDQQEIYEKEQKQGICTCPEKDYKWEEVNENASRMICLKCPFCKKHWHTWHDRSHKKEMADQEYLFKYLNKHVRKWWD